MKGDSARGAERLLDNWKGFLLIFSGKKRGKRKYDAVLDVRFKWMRSRPVAERERGEEGWRGEAGRNAEKEETGRGGRGKMSRLNTHNLLQLSHAFHSVAFMKMWKCFLWRQGRIWIMIIIEMVMRIRKCGRKKCAKNNNIISCKSRSSCSNITSSYIYDNSN